MPRSLLKFIVPGITAFAVALSGSLMAQQKKTGDGKPPTVQKVEIPKGKICDSNTADGDNDGNVCTIDVIVNDRQPTIQSIVYFDLPVNKKILWKIKGANPHRYGFKDESLKITAGGTGFDTPCATDNKNQCPHDGQVHRMYHWHAANPQKQRADYDLTLYPPKPGLAPIVVKIVILTKDSDEPVSVDPTIFIQG